MLRVKLRVLDARNRRRGAIAAHYSSASVPRCDPPRTRTRPRFHQYVIRTARREPARALAADDIDTGVHYPVPIHRQPAWLRTLARPRATAGGAAAEEMLSLPVHADLTDAEVDRVADAVTRFFRR